MFAIVLELTKMLPKALDKNVVILNNTCVPKGIREHVWKEIMAAKNTFDSFGFLEWAEPFLSKLNKRYPLADARLLTAEEHFELGVIAA